MKLVTAILSEQVERKRMKYSSPVVKTALTPAFRFGAICKCQIAQSGSVMLRRSEKTLTVPETTNIVFLLMQWLP